MLMYKFFLLVCCKCIDMVKVKTEGGILEGEKLLNSLRDKSYYSFKGIPYAAPPVGELRFMPPQPPASWKGVRPAKKHGSICIQDTSVSYERSPGSEDCLFLNVYTPNLKPERPLPVMFFIHGGSYLFGSGNSDIYGPDFLIRYDVVLVTSNYRLGILGFLNLNIEEATGNAGLKDQAAALRWVNRNIRNFGGDPDNVTIFGQSSGSNSVTLHLFSPLSKGLFRRAIGLSGTLLNDVFRSFKSRSRGLAAARQLGLDTRNATEAFFYLQNLPVKELSKVTPNVLISENFTYAIGTTNYFVPVVEKDFGREHFITSDPVKKLQHCEFDCNDLMIGSTDKEGLIDVANYEAVLPEYYGQYPELLVPIKITRTRSPNEVIDLSRIIYEYYFDNKHINSSTIRQLVDFYTYYYYLYDVDRFTRFWARGCKNTYFYKFKAFTGRNYFALAAARFNITGASHGDDILYLFDLKNLNLPKDVNSTALKVIDNFCTLLTNFAKFGNPMPNASADNVWPQYGENQNYVLIDEGLKTEVVSYEGPLGFWRTILKKARFIY